MLSGFKMLHKSRKCFLSNSVSREEMGHVEDEPVRVQLLNGNIDRIHGIAMIVRCMQHNIIFLPLRNRCFLSHGDLPSFIFIGDSRLRQIAMRMGLGFYGRFEQFKFLMYQWVHASLFSLYLIVQLHVGKSNNRNHDVFFLLGIMMTFISSLSELANPISTFFESVPCKTWAVCSGKGD